MKIIEPESPKEVPEPDVNKTKALKVLPIQKLGSIKLPVTTIFLGKRIFPEVYNVLKPISAVNLVGFPTGVTFDIISSR